MTTPVFQRITPLLLILLGFVAFQSNIATSPAAAHAAGRVNATPPSAASEKAIFPSVSPRFRVPPIFPTDKEEQNIVAADFNGDGKIDIAVATGEGVDLLLGNGDGTFQPKHLIKGKHTFGMAVADLNNDGIPDLVVTTEKFNQTAGLEILLGNGNGTFGTRETYPVGQYAASIAIGDFNGDGNLDVAVTEPADHSILVLPGDGKGSLGTGTPYLMPGSHRAEPNSIVAGDFNDDGNLDLAVADGDLFIFYGDGNGMFQPSHAIAQAENLEEGDMNGDGRPDIVTDRGVLLNEGDGAFTFYQYNGGAILATLAIGDFNGDGIPDLVSENVGIMLGRGNGTFRPVGATYSEGPSAGALVAADFNHDGKLDIVQIASLYSDGVATYLGNGDGTLRAVRSYADGISTTLQVTADFNNDGKMDIAEIGQDRLGDPTLEVLEGNGQGSLKTLNALPLTATPISAIPGDFNNDGNVDVALLTVDDVLILPGKGDGTFNAPIATSIPYGSNAFAVADFDHNGTLDIAVLEPCPDEQYCPSNVLIYLGNGDGTFKAVGSFQTGLYSVGIVAADFNNDGIPDLAVDNEVSPYGYGSISILMGNGDGTFQPQTLIADAGDRPTGIAVADFNADGNQDILVVDSGGIVNVHLGLGNGRFPSHVTTTLVKAGPMTIADFNGDGFPDLAVAEAGIQVYIGAGNGKFQPPITLLAGDAQPSSIQAAFLGPSALPDIVAPLSEYEESVDVIINLGR